MEFRGDRRQSIDAAGKTRLAAFLAGHDPFVVIRNTMPLQYVRMFLLIALDEGKDVGEYGRLVGVNQSVASRHISDIGDIARDGTPGFGLVTTKIDPLNRRRHTVYLTDKGRIVAAAVIRAMENAGIRWDER